MIRIRHRVAIPLAGGARFPESATRSDCHPCDWCQGWNSRCDDPELPFLTILIWVVMRSLIVSVWLMTPTFFPRELWRRARASITVASESGSRVPNPSSINRLASDTPCDDRAESPSASPRLTMNVSPPDSDVVSRMSSALSWSITLMPSESFTCISS